MIHNLKFEGVSFNYENSENIFNQVDFEFPLNQIVWVKAISGAGRSTLLQLLGALQLPQEGRYLINDQDVTQMTFEEFLPYRLQIGYGFDFGGLIHNKTLLDNVTLPLLYHKVCSKSEAEDRAKSYFDRLNASKHMKQRPADVPGGIRKLICLIRALIHHPQLLLLDDPSVGLHQEVMLKYFDLIQELRSQGKVSHVYISSFDEKLMGLIEHEEVYLDQGFIYKNQHEIEKKAVNL